MVNHLYNKILIIDDDEDLSFIISDMLEGYGYQVTWADSSEKPYSMKELLSRVNALVRRTYGFSQQESVVTFGNVKVNLTARSVTKNGKGVFLSLREFDLLSYLCRNKNAAIEKEKLIAEVWGAFSTVEPSTLTVHIRWLREKLEDDPANPRFIKTKHRVGYMLEVQDEE